MANKSQKPKEATNAFVSNDGEYVAIRIPDTEHSFDVWKHDCTACWEGVRYIERPDAAGEFAPRTVYQKKYTYPTKVVISHTKRGATSFDLELCDTVTTDTFIVRFNTSMPSLAKSFVKRREKKVD